VQVPPPVGVGLHVLARRGLAQAGRGAEQSRGGQPLDALDPEVDAVRLELGLRIDALDEGWLRRDRRSELLARQHTHRVGC
jgi:hypothetical protein